MKRFTNVLLLLLLAVTLLMTPIVSAEVNDLVAPRTLDDGLGGTILFSMTLDDVTGTILIVQEHPSADSTKYWKSITQIRPDATGNNQPEVTIIEYTPPIDLPVYDVNRDGSVDSRDFWLVFRYVFLGL